MNRLLTIRKFGRIAKRVARRVNRKYDWRYQRRPYRVKRPLSFVVAHVLPHNTYEVQT